jgi:3'-phosphoadenosine 5'-phosphosulfate sulfotransferase (PAPS reductase)/FAD synthetase
VIEKYWGENDGNVYVSFSGGKDSTVLLDVVRDLFPDTLAVFCDTGLEYPEVKQFIGKTENVEIIRPKLSYRQVVKKYGYPVVSKDVALKIRTIRRDPTKAIANYYMTGYRKDGVYSRRALLPKKWRYLIDAPFRVSEQCCDVMKKRPFRKYERVTGRKPYLGNMAGESGSRAWVYMKQGCITTKGCTPLAFWRECDIWDYIHDRNLPYTSIYDNGADRTGCMWCMFGIHMEDEPNRLERMKDTHPKIHKYCINSLGLGRVMDFMGIKYQ